MRLVARLLLVLALWVNAAPLITSLSARPYSCCSQEDEPADRRGECPACASPCCPLRPALACEAPVLPDPVDVEGAPSFASILVPVLDGSPQRVFHPPKPAPV